MNKHHWMELVPVDRYCACTNGLLHDFDRKVLTMLYQPLIGSRCLSLYMTLWSELEQHQMWGKETTHHTLMVYTNLSLKKIYDERRKLEGIGLLKVHMKEEESDRSFIYELVPPLSPKAFFDEVMLNIFLYHRLGKTKYNSVKSFFIYPTIDTASYKDISCSFNDVFGSAHEQQVGSMMKSENGSDLVTQEGHELKDRQDRKELQLQNDFFNFELFYEGLADAIIPKKAITEKVKEAVTKLAFLYQMDHLHMKSVMMGAITDNNTIDIEQLRKNAREWYQFEYGDKMPALIELVQPLQNRTMENKEPSTEEEGLIKQLEQMSPRQFLIAFSGGAEPSGADLKIIEDVMFKQKLLPGVVNVLIYYVMLRTDMKLSKVYVEKIAGHWARKKITTVPDAMRIAKEEHRQYQDWAEGKTTAKRTPKSKSGRKEILPDWADKEKVQPEVAASNVTGDAALDEKRRKLEEILNEFKN